MDDGTSARRLWPLFEAVHAVVYFSEEPRQALTEVGYKGFWMSYFAARMAPLGEVGPAVAQPACFGFAPERVHRALPDAWRYAGADSALATRLAGSSAALARLLGPGLDAAQMTDAADLAWAAAQAADCDGRILATGNQAVARPSDSLAALWQACTTLREHRGDGHNAVLMAERVSPVEAHLIKLAASESEPDTLRSSRQHSDTAWAAGRAALEDRHWVDAVGLTADGRAARERIEQRTDQLAARPWAELGADGTAALEEIIQHAAALVADDIPYPNPIGVPPAQVQ